MNSQTRVCVYQPAATVLSARLRRVLLQMFRGNIIERRPRPQAVLVPSVPKPSRLRRFALPVVPPSHPRGSTEKTLGRLSRRLQCVKYRVCRAPRPAAGKRSGAGVAPSPPHKARFSESDIRFHIMASVYHLGLARKEASPPRALGVLAVCPQWPSNVPLLVTPSNR